MWLLDGIAAVPANRIARVEDLTLDSREVRAGSLFFALRGPQRAWPQVCRRGRRARRERGAVGARPRRAGAAAALRRVRGRDTGTFARWWAASPTGSSIGPPRSCASPASPAPTARPPAPTCWRNASRSLGCKPPTSAPSAGAESARSRVPTLTTPDVVTLHRVLAQLRASGVREVAMEVSSQALDQDRIAGVRLHSAAFTNLSRDHLDYHQTMAAYGAAKARLFAAPDLKHIIINVGDAFGRELAQNYAGRVPLTAVWIGAGGSGWLAERALRAIRCDVGLARRLDAARRQLRQGGGRDPAAGPLQRRERLGGRGLPACRWARRSPMRSVCWPSACRRRDAWKWWSPSPAASPWRWSTMRTRPMRWPRPWARCASIARERCGACSAAAAIAIPASAASWAPSPTSWPIRSSSPTTIRAPRIRRPSPAPSPAASHRATVRVIHDRGEAIARRLERGAAAGRGADRGQGPRGLPNLRRYAAQFQRSARSAALFRGGGMIWERP